MDRFHVMLTPSPADVTKLVTTCLTMAWPDVPAERASFLQACRLVEAPDSENSEGRVGRGVLMASELSAISGGWVALDDRLFSINVFLYVSPATAPEPSREGYQQIRRAIGAQVGPPAAEDPVTKAGAACLWRNQEVGIELYHHTYPESLVQVGISRLEINTEYEVLVATGNTTG